MGVLPTLSEAWSMCFGTLSILRMRTFAAYQPKVLQIISNPYFSGSLSQKIDTSQDLQKTFFFDSYQRCLFCWALGFCKNTPKTVALPVLPIELLWWRNEHLHNWLGCISRTLDNFHISSSGYSMPVNGCNIMLMVQKSQGQPPGMVLKPWE